MIFCVQCTLPRFCTDDMYFIRFVYLYCCVTMPFIYTCYELCWVYTMCYIYILCNGDNVLLLVLMNCITWLVYTYWVSSFSCFLLQLYRSQPHVYFILSFFCGSWCFCTPLINALVCLWSSFFIRTLCYHSKVCVEICCSVCFMYF